MRLTTRIIDEHPTGSLLINYYPLVIINHIKLQVAFNGRLPLLKCIMETDLFSTNGVIVMLVFREDHFGAQWGFSEPSHSVSQI
jgi:hypothetical protein